MRRAILLFLCLAGACLWGQGNGATIRGHVLDAHGRAVVRANVTLRNTLSGSGQTARTSDAGEYQFSGISSGAYIITASAAGLAAQTHAVHVTSGKSEQVTDISLPVASVQQDVTVVSGSRVEELQQDSPLPIDVVTRQRIGRTGFESVADVLSELPGVVTRNNASYSGSSQEQIDGIASQDVLVLQDGLPIVGARGINSGIIDLDQQNIGRLDRIEVVRGAASSLYGTDAICGVINVITHEPTHPIEGGLRISGGNLGVVDGIWTSARNSKSSPPTPILSCTTSTPTH
jgi:outer membrane receptor for ferrienterochelin and colicins